MKKIKMIMEKRVISQTMIKIIMMRESKRRRRKRRGRRRTRIRSLSRIS